MKAKTGTVTGVIRQDPRPPQVNVDTGGPNGVPGVQCPGWYDPQRGDAVTIVDLFDTGVWKVFDCQTRRGLFQVSTPDVSFGASVPDGFQQFATVHGRTRPDGGTSVFGVLSGGGTSGPPPAASFRAAASSAATWDAGNGWSNNGRADQGVYPDGSGLQTFGAWFLPATTAASITGMTRGHATVTRYAGTNGADGAVQLHVWIHALTGPTGGQPVFSTETIPAGANPSRGAACDFDLSAAHVAAIAAGTALGIGITATSTDLYAAMNADLSILFS